METKTDDMVGFRSAIHLWNSKVVGWDWQRRFIHTLVPGRDLNIFFK